MTKPTISVQFELVEGEGSYADTFSSDVAQTGLSFRYGFFNNKPTFPHVAGSGEGRFFFDNSSSDLPYTEASSDGSIRGKGIGTKYRIIVNYDSDNLDPFIFEGRATEWNVSPGLFEDRLTEVVAQDYMNDLNRYLIKSLAVQQTVNAAAALDDVISSNGMPYAPSAYSFSTNGETFTIVFHDIVLGESKGIKPFSKIAESELGHVYAEAGTLYYMTQEDWIAQGRSIGTLDNRWSTMEVTKNRDLEYSPVYITYYPAELAATTDVVVANFTETGYVLAANTSRTIRLNYRDPSNKSVSLTVPGGASVYWASSGSSDIGSDCYLTYTDLGSAVELGFVNNSAYPVTFVELYAFGQPVYLYESVDVVSTDAPNPSATPLHLQLKYEDSLETAKLVRDYLVEKYSLYPSNNTAQSVSFIATADSDMMTLAMRGKVGKSVTIVEDVNVINEPYIITSVAWDVYAPELIQVTWGLWPEERWARYFAADTDNTYMVDSDGNRFAYWR